MSQKRKKLYALTFEPLPPEGRLSRLVRRITGRPRRNELIRMFVADNALMVANRGEQKIVAPAIVEALERIPEDVKRRHHIRYAVRRVQ